MIPAFFCAKRKRLPQNADCYDIPPFRQTSGFKIGLNAGTWNRRNNSKNNGSMSFSAFVAFGRWNVVFTLNLDFETASLKQQ